MSTHTITFSEALEKMKQGAVVARKAWDATEKIMKLVTKDAWDGAFPINQDMIMVNEGNGWGVWCSCLQEDVLATDFFCI